jgi:glutathione S-transferase
MTQLILHHHDPSPFAEKIRLAFGVKGLSWQSVQIPMIMPKPDLTAVTGGYRKTPVLQIGADVYCDTSLIARELEERFPEPSLFPAGHPGLAYALGRWSDKAFFEPGAALSMGENPEIPAAVLSDRKAFFNFMDFDRMAAQMPHMYAQFLAHCQLLEDELQSGRSRFLIGDQPSWLDIQAYFPVWMAAGNIPRAAELLQPFEKIRRWSRTMEGIGHGHRRELDSKDALSIARRSEPRGPRGVQPSGFHDFQAGETVRVEPDDYGAVPVVGALSGLDNHRIAIERVDPDLGRTTVHFPRVGYRLERARPVRASACGSPTVSPER